MRAGPWSHQQTFPGAARCHATELAILQSGSPLGPHARIALDGRGLGSCVPQEATVAGKAVEAFFRGSDGATRRFVKLCDPMRRLAWPLLKEQPNHDEDVETG